MNKYLLIIILIINFSLAADSCLGSDLSKCLDHLLINQLVSRKIDLKYNIKVPPVIGTKNQEIYEDLSRILIDSFSEYDTIVVHGSRVHFSIGIPPGKSSDLDIVLFPMEKMANEVVNTQSAAAFSSIKNKYGIAVEEVVPMSSNLEKQLASDEKILIQKTNSKTKFTSHSKQDEERFWQKCLQDAKKFAWEMSRLKSCITDLLDGKLMKESVIITKRRPDDEAIKTLIDRDYKNIIFINENGVESKTLIYP